VNICANFGGPFGTSRSNRSGHAFNRKDSSDHRLGGEAMADGIAAGPLLAFFGIWTGAFARIAAVGLDLPEGSH